MYDTPIRTPLLACYQDAYSLCSVFINAVWPPLTYVTLRLRVNLRNLTFTQESVDRVPHVAFPSFPKLNRRFVLFLNPTGSSFPKPNLSAVYGAQNASR